MNFVKSFKKGFTLIELLVVVAIIAILAAVVMAMLGDARNKGVDGAVKQNLANARSQAEVFYNTNTAVVNSYTSVCTNGVVGGAKGIGNLVLAAGQATGLSSYTPNGTGTVGAATCNNTGNVWAAEAPLKGAGANQMWCVDSTGKSKQENNATIGTGYVCP